MIAPTRVLLCGWKWNFAESLFPFTVHGGQNVELQAARDNLAGTAVGAGNEIRKRNRLHVVRRDRRLSNAHTGNDRANHAQRKNPLHRFPYLPPVSLDDLPSSRKRETSQCVANAVNRAGCASTSPTRCRRPNLRARPRPAPVVLPEQRPDRIRPGATPRTPEASTGRPPNSSASTITPSFRRARGAAQERVAVRDSFRSRRAGRRLRPVAEVGAKPGLVEWQRQSTRSLTRIRRFQRISLLMSTHALA